ncbi:DUF4240 domain-containing protein [Cellulosimicrobium sp. PMB13]|uniref:DUF4240 domain-containing protein n=1 Tax=Cellulosimicrobium sp. PMB13 TaxID=3120158 RepID=UPI003F4C4170
MRPGRPVTNTREAIVARGRAARGDTAPSSEFWRLVALGHGRCDADALVPLQLAFDQPSERPARAFARDFARAVEALNTPAHAAQLVRDESEPLDSPLLPMSDDVFLSARCAVIAAGREEWERVVADPAALSGRWRVADGELFFAVVHDIALDAGENALDELAASLAQPDDSWLGGGGGHDVGVPVPAAYRWAELELGEALAASDAWRAWWSASGRGRLDLLPFVSPDVSDVVRLRRRRCSYELAMTIDSAGMHGEDPQRLADLAVAHLRVQIEAVRERLHLPPTPPWPELPPVPDDLSCFEGEDPVTPEEVGEALAELGMGQEFIDSVVRATRWS